MDGEPDSGGGPRHGPPDNPCRDGGANGQGPGCAVRSLFGKTGHAAEAAAQARDPLDVALEADDVEIPRTEDVQVGRRGPTWTS